MSQDNSIPFGPPPPEDQMREARTILPPPPAYVRTLADRLPDGLSDPGVLTPPIQLGEPLVLIKPREPQEPAFGKVTQVGFGDESWLGWVTERLAARHSMMRQVSWVTWLRQFFGSSHVFFKRTDRAIALAMVQVNPFSAEQYVQPVFVLHMDLGPEGGSMKGSQGEREAITLVREMREWGRLRGAVEIRQMTEWSDLPASIYVTQLKAERRDEVWLKLK